MGARIRINKMDKLGKWLKLSGVLLSIAFSFSIYSCSTSTPVKKQAYAKLKSEKTFEHELQLVWKAVEEVMRDYKLLKREPAERDSKEALLTTDWIYTRSRDKYVEYKVNELPRKKYLQMRVRYQIEAKKVMGGTHVLVRAEEELEMLKPDGTPGGYQSASEPDTSRTNELLNKINLAILSRNP